MLPVHALITHDCVLFAAKPVPCAETWIQKRPWHGCAGRRCSSEATKRTGLAVIWHTVKDPRNLHSDCVPVGRAELCLCLSLAMLLLAPVPKLASALLSGAGGGPRSASSLWQAAMSPLSSTYSSKGIHWHVYTHTHTQLSSSSSAFQKVLAVRQDFICLGFLHWNAERGSPLLFRFSANRAGQCFNVQM